MFQKIKVVCIATVMALSLSTPLQADLPLTGHRHPVFALNLATARDYNPGMQFLDIMKTGRPWIGHKAGQWGGTTFEQLRDSGYLDDAGWVRAIPDGLESVGTVFSWDDEPQMDRYRSGRYVLRYEGSGDLRLNGGARAVSVAPGEIVFDVSPGRKNWRVDIFQTASNDYIRNITIVPERFVALHDAGAVFNPDWLRLVQDAREIRFMNWGGTNNSEQVRWSDRPTPNSAFLKTGHAIEYMVQLANEVGADAWFTIPHKADPDYIRRYAEYVRDHLDPNLQVRIEWSNEVWNWIFRQTHWTRDQSAAVWGEEAHRDYGVKMATQTAQIWRDVFQGENATRLQTVLSGHAANPWDTGKLLEAGRWKKHEPNNWVSPAETFDAFAVTSYFGGTLARDAEQRAALLREMNRPNVDINLYLADTLGDPAMRSSVPSRLSLLREHAAIVDAYGMDLILYEGGQHVHSALNPKLRDQAQDTSPEDIERMHAVLAAFVRSPEMAALYRDLWNGWATIGQGPFMQYSDVTQPNNVGSFGLYAHLFDDSPRAAMVRDLAQAQTPWWPSDGGAHYQQGVTLTGTEQADDMQGTTQEDYLLGAGGDDIFFVSLGRDGLHGGAGQDAAIFALNAESYTWQAEGRGLRVVGPGSSDFLIEIETLIFADGAQYTVADLLK